MMAPLAATSWPEAAIAIVGIIAMAAIWIVVVWMVSR